MMITTTALTIAALLMPGVAEQCTTDSGGPGSSCNSAGNVPNAIGQYHCSMAAIGLGDCACDFTQSSGDIAYPGIVNCDECHGTYDPNVDWALHGLVFELADAIAQVLAAHPERGRDV